MDSKRLGKKLDKYFDQLEKDIIADIARRVKKAERWTETAELQVQALKDMGYSPVKIQREVLAILRADKEYQKWLAANTIEQKAYVKRQIDRTIKKALKQGDKIIAAAGTSQWITNMRVWKQGSKGVSKAGKRLVENCKKQVQGEILNLVKTTGFQIGLVHTPMSKVFTRAMNQTFINIATGGFSGKEAINKITRDLVRRGMTSINYKNTSGKRSTINTKAGVRRCMRSSLGRLSNDIGYQNAQELDTDLVEINQTATPRGDGTMESSEDHAWWQGRVYSISGKSYAGTAVESAVGYEILPLEVTGYPHDPLGLGGYNCGHEMYPYIFIEDAKGHGRMHYNN